MYRIVLKKSAKKFLDKLPPNERIRIVREIEKLPKGEDIKPLRGHDGLMRLRIGKYRAVYTVDNGRLLLLMLTAADKYTKIYDRKNKARYRALFFVNKHFPYNL